MLLFSSVWKSWWLKHSIELSRPNKDEWSCSVIVLPMRMIDQHCSTSSVCWSFNILNDKTSYLPKPKVASHIFGITEVWRHCEDSNFKPSLYTLLKKLVRLETNETPLVAISSESLKKILVKTNLQMFVIGMTKLLQISEKFSQIRKFKDKINAWNFNSNDA